MAHFFYKYEFTPLYGHNSICVENLQFCEIYSYFLKVFYLQAQQGCIPHSFLLKFDEKDEK